MLWGERAGGEGGEGKRLGWGVLGGRTRGGRTPGHTGTVLGIGMGLGKEGNMHVSD